MANKQISNLFDAPQTAIASYDWTDIASGFGFVSFYLTTADDGKIYQRILSEKALSSSEPAGVIETNGTYEFQTSVFNSPREIKGTANLMGFANGAATLSGKIYILDDTNYEEKEDIIKSDDSEFSTTSESYVLVATYTDIERFHKVDYELKATHLNHSGTVKFEITYLDGQVYELIRTAGFGDTIYLSLSDNKGLYTLPKFRK